MLPLIPEEIVQTHQREWKTCPTQILRALMHNYVVNMPENGRFLPLCRRIVSAIDGAAPSTPYATAVVGKGACLGPDTKQFAGVTIPTGSTFRPTADSKAVKSLTISGLLQESFRDLDAKDVAQDPLLCRSLRAFITDYSLYRLAMGAAMLQQLAPRTAGWTSWGLDTILQQRAHGWLCVVKTPELRRLNRVYAAAESLACAFIHLPKHQQKIIVETIIPLLQNPRCWIGHAFRPKLILKILCAIFPYASLQQQDVLLPILYKYLQLRLINLANDGHYRIIAWQMMTNLFATVNEARRERVFIALFNIYKDEPNPEVRKAAAEMFTVVFTELSLTQRINITSLLLRDFAILSLQAREIVQQKLPDLFQVVTRDTQILWVEALINQLAHTKNQRPISQKAAEIIRLLFPLLNNNDRAVLQEKYRNTAFYVAIYQFLDKDSQKLVLDYIFLAIHNPDKTYKVQAWFDAAMIFIHIDSEHQRRVIAELDAALKTDKIPLTLLKVISLIATALNKSHKELIIPYLMAAFSKPPITDNDYHVIEQAMSALIILFADLNKKQQALVIDKILMDIAAEIGDNARAQKLEDLATIANQLDTEQLKKICILLLEDFITPNPDTQQVRWQLLSVLFPHFDVAGRTQLIASARALPLALQRATYDERLVMLRCMPTLFPHLTQDQQLALLASLSAGLSDHSHSVAITTQTLNSIAQAHLSYPQQVALTRHFADALTRGHHVAVLQYLAEQSEVTQRNLLAHESLQPTLPVEVRNLVLKFL